MSNAEIGIHLFLQLTAIIVACRVIGWLGRRFLAQTQVFMEMMTGVVLGPSVFGLLAPAAQAWLFPKRLTFTIDGITQSLPHPSMSILYALAQVGLVLYMFVIGLEFDLNRLRGRTRAASAVSGIGIIVPFVAAAALIPYLLVRADLFGPGVSSWLAWLFTGTCISITAFPMLARMLYERGIASTDLGTLTLAAASIDDAVAWCLLALVLALFRQSPDTLVLAAGGGLLYAVLMLGVGRSVFKRLARGAAGNGDLSSDKFSTVLVLLMLFAFVTDLIGIYAVFGAFIFGVALPKGRFAEALTLRLEQLTTSLFVPMFFVYSGLNTKLGLLDSVELWVVTGVVFAVAVVGKGVACMLAARATGETWRRSATVGTLMNARGMMELILLNIGLERGVITPTFFTIMVIMAVVTTGMASPLCELMLRNLALDGARIPGTRKPLSVPPIELPAIALRSTDP